MTTWLDSRYKTQLAISASASAACPQLFWTSVRCPAMQCAWLVLLLSVMAAIVPVKQQGKPAEHMLQPFLYLYLLVCR
jgi:hypothetical protein